MDIPEVGYPMTMLIYKDSMGSILMGVPYPMNGHAVVGWCYPMALLVPIYSSIENTFPRLEKFMIAEFLQFWLFKGILIRKQILEAIS